MVWMLHGSCVSERPACSRSAGGLAASAAVPAVSSEHTHSEMTYRPNVFGGTLNPAQPNLHTLYSLRAVFCAIVIFN